MPTLETASFGVIRPKAANLATMIQTHCLWSAIDPTSPERTELQLR
jgi:hypothetical protein